MEAIHTAHLVDVSNVKIRLLNKVCASMISEPKFYAPSTDQNKLELSDLLKKVAAGDAEFLLKVALYVRDDLNIRSTANYILAVAANTKACHPFLNKYFSHCVRLPSDMLEVASMYLDLPDRYLPDGSIPAPLRKAVVQKFQEFDQYSLAKYNKEKSMKRKARKAKSRMDMEERVQETVQRKAPKLTLKQLIRKVHISEPAESVMAIVGKKYPTTAEDFKKTGIIGEWDESKAGKRMKLPIPETWETQLSAKGNKHSTWEELIDHNKLPFMAMLRNLRNLIVTGISPSHHEIILTRLTDERSVVTSRQLPWRFLSAYQAINVDLEKLMNDIIDHDLSGHKIIQVPVRGKKGKQMGANRTIKKRAIIPIHMPDVPLIKRYEEAIDTAIRLSTMHNLPPIEGKTVIFCDVSGSMKEKCKTKGNMGSIQTVYEVAILLGLMIQNSCDECDFRIFSSPPKPGAKCHVSVPLQQNTLLGNIKRVSDEADKLGGGTDFPYDYLEDAIRERRHFDTFVILSDMMIAPGRQELKQQSADGKDNNNQVSVSSVLKRYRNLVNPNLLFVAIDLYGSGKSLVDVSTAEGDGGQENDVLITGFSDSILRFVAQRGATLKQLQYVENIDKTKRCGQPRRKRKQPREQKVPGTDDASGVLVKEKDEEEGESEAPMDEEGQANKGKAKA